MNQPLHVQKALKTIASAVRNDHTSLHELAAIVFLLAGNKNSSNVTQRAVQKLLAQNITTLPFPTACYVVAALYVDNPQHLHGEQLAYITKKLISYEAAPGGPYTKNVAKNDVLKINSAIDTLFTAFKTPLPAVKQYLKEKSYINQWPKTSALTNACLTVINSRQKPTPRHAIFNEFDRYSEPISSTLSRSFTDMQAHSVFNEIETIAKQSSQALKKPLRLSPTHYKNLRYANIYFWLSYSLYDAIIDTEPNAHTKLPAANIAHRQSLLYFNNPLNNTPRFKQNITQYYNKIDEANAWELANCRFKTSRSTITVDNLPQYKNNMHILAHRALGHIIGPLIVAKLAGANSYQYQNIYNGLYAYLIAKQINDDLHDWKQDVTRGHISYVVATLFKHAHITKGTYTTSELHDKLRRTFYSKTMHELCNVVITYSNTAHAALVQSNIYRANAPFLELVRRPNYSALQTLAMAKQQKDFMRSIAPQNR